MDRYEKLHKKFLNGHTKSEAEFQSYLTAFSKHQGHWIYKISDTGMAYKPFDCIIVNKKGETAFVELKIEKRKKVNLNTLLYPHQTENLKRLSALGATAIVVVYHIPEHNIKTYTINDLENPIEIVNSFE